MKFSEIRNGEDGCEGQGLVILEAGLRSFSSYDMYYLRTLFENIKSQTFPETISPGKL